MTDFKPGDRVYVTDEGLAQLRDVMRRATGHEPPPNHYGTVNDIWEDGTVEIWFDNEDGEGQGSSAPYPASEVRHLFKPSGRPATGQYSGHYQDMGDIEHL